MSDRLSARDQLASLLSRSEDVALPAHTADPLGWEGYDELLTGARESTGIDEAVIAVRGQVDGGPDAVFVAWDFSFLGGSMGAATGERIALAFDHAREQELPIVLLPATGGARMQEGMASLAQMAATTVASRRHADAGLLQVSVLRDPTTGGVFASHANLADVVYAVPGATIGFAGPRVAEAMTDGPLPSGSHTAEGARAAGLVDAVVEPDALPERLARVLAWPGGGGPTGTVEVPDGDRAPLGGAWAEVERARAGDRSRASAFLAQIDVAEELHGDRAGTDDPTVRVALGRLAGRAVVVVAMDRDANQGRISPGGYRKAWRGLDLAERLGVPVVTLIDTPGADAGAASEAGGIAHHIARTFERVLTLRAPVVSCTIGEGGSGGALALAVGDRVLIQEHAIFSVIGPEGAAAILHRDAGRAPDVAERLRLTAPDLEELGLADEVVPEPAGGEVAAALAAVCRHLDELGDRPIDELVDRRLRRWRRAGGHHR